MVECIDFAGSEFVLRDFFENCNLSDTFRLQVFDSHQ